VNADKNRAPVGIGDGDSRAESNENITAPRHHHTIPRGLEEGTQALGDVQRHHTFRNALTRNSAAIKAAVTGIDNNSGSDGGSEWSRGQGGED
jgi:hypothetical protein